MSVGLPQTTTVSCTGVQLTTSENVYLRWACLCLLLLGATGDTIPGRNSKKGTIAPFRAARSNQTGSGALEEKEADEEPGSPGSQNLTDDDSREPREKGKKRGRTMDAMEEAEDYYDDEDEGEHRDN